MDPGALPKQNLSSLRAVSPPFLLSVTAAQAGFLHLADALAFCHNSEVIGSTVRAIVATLKSSKTWNVEPELVSKGGVVPPLPQPASHFSRPACPPLNLNMVLFLPSFQSSKA